MKMFNSLTMSTRFNLLNVVLVLVTALSMGIIVTYVQLSRQLNTHHEHGLALATLLAETSEYAVYTHQNSMLEHQLMRLRKVSELAYVVILDEQGQILAQMQTREDRPVPTLALETHNPVTFWQWLVGGGRQHFVEIDQPITSSGFQDEGALFMETQGEPKVIGHVRLAMSLAYFQEIVRYSLQLGLLVVVIILAIGLGISLSMTARITSPLKQLTRSAHGVINGQIETVSLSSKDQEMEELGLAFNLMITWLIDYRTEVKNYQAMLERQAYYDDLTGLANRALLKEQLHLALTQTERRHTSAALLFLDLDRFKYINDTFGHSFGDQLLQEVAQRLHHHIRACDIVARMGGDEFVIILNDLDQEASLARRDAQQVAEQIGLALSLPFEIRGHDISTSFSIGIALCPHDANDGETLVRNADCAMYEAKKQGRNTYRFYEATLQQRSIRRLSLETGLKRALEQNELVLYFQPKFDCHSHCLVGAEALLRWHYKDVWISPVEFIPLAEETGLILSIGAWVLEQALVTLSDWRLKGIVDSDFQLSVNVSPPQFWHPGFVRSTLDIISRCMPDVRGVLELELTESCLLRPSKEIQGTFAELRQAGLCFAMDDFGTGYSSLSYLKQFPLDVLKIDQSFVHDCIDDPSDATIIRAIIAMAHGLGLDVIAEGVETVEHLAFLKGEGCHLIQGYLLAKPMPAEKFAQFCQNFSNHPILDRS